MPQIQPIHLDEQLCFQVYSANKKFNHFYQQALKPFDLTYPQYIAMLTLWQYAPLSVKQLGEYLHLDSGTLTPLLKRLESHGWISRSRSRSDERTAVIQLTDKAKEQQNVVYGHINSCFDILGLTPDEKETCMQAMTTLEQKLDLYNDPQV